MDDRLPETIFELAPHLRENAECQQCDRCGRKTWSSELFGVACKMRQPDGSRCTGQFVPAGGCAP